MFESQPNQTILNHQPQPQHQHHQLIQTASSSIPATAIYAAVMEHQAAVAAAAAAAATAAAAAAAASATASEVIKNSNNSGSGGSSGVATTLSQPTGCILVNDLIYYKPTQQQLQPTTTQPIIHHIPASASSSSSLSHQLEGTPTVLVGVRLGSVGGSNVPSTALTTSSVCNNNLNNNNGSITNTNISTNLIQLNDMVVMSPSPHSTSTISSSSSPPSSSLNSSSIVSHNNTNKLGTTVSSCLMNTNENSNSSSTSAMNATTIPAVATASATNSGNKYVPNSKKPQKKKAAQLTSELDEERTSQLVSEILKSIKEKTKELESMNQNLKSTNQQHQQPLSASSTSSSSSSSSSTTCLTSNATSTTHHHNIATAATTSSSNNVENNTNDMTDTSSTPSYSTDNSPSLPLLTVDQIHSSKSPLAAAVSTASSVVSNNSSLSCALPRCQPATPNAFTPLNSASPPKQVYSSPPAPSSTSSVAAEIPIGWTRSVEKGSSGAIVYTSPSGVRLKSYQEVRAYLLCENTCKCGLQCPLNIYTVFDFTSTSPLGSSPHSNHDDISLMGCSCQSYVNSYQAMAAQVGMLAKSSSSSKIAATVSKKQSKPRKKVLDELNQNGSSGKTCVKKSSGKRANQDSNKSRSKQQEQSKKVCINEAFVNANRVIYSSSSQSSSSCSFSTSSASTASSRVETNVTNQQIESRSNSALVDEAAPASQSGALGDTVSAISSPATFADFVLSRTDSTVHSDGDIFIRNFNFALVDKISQIDVSTDDQIARQRQNDTTVQKQLEFGSRSDENYEEKNSAPHDLSFSQDYSDFAGLVVDNTTNGI